MHSGFRNWGCSATVRLDGYSRWLAFQDFTDVYHRHRHVLTTLGGADGRRWLLKAPAHSAELPADDPTGMIDRYHAAHPRHAKGAHHYTLDDFALDEAAIRARFASWAAL